VKKRVACGGKIAKHIAGVKAYAYGVVVGLASSIEVLVM
jgi:hypothetical protein